MAVKIVLKNSSVEDRRPTAGQLENGEIALNYNEAGAFLTCKDTNGDIQQVGGVKINDTAPDNPTIQCLWFQPVSFTLFVFDGDSWLPVGGGGQVDRVIGNQGITAVSPRSGGDVVLLDADLDDNGLRFLNSKIALNIGDGLKFENQKLVADAATSVISIDDLTDVDTSTDVPNPGEILVWDGTNWVPGSLPDVDLKDPVTIGDSAPDPVDENYFWWDSSRGELFVGYEDPSGDSYWVSASRPGQDGAPGKDGDPVVISQDTRPPFQEDAIWFDTSSGEAYFGYVDPSGDEYWVALSKPGAPGKDGDPVIISQDITPDVVEDAIWFNTATGEAFFGYVDPSGDDYWVALSKPGAPGTPGKDGDPVIISQDVTPNVVEDAIWFNTSSGEAFFGYVDPSGDDYWVALSKPGAPGKDGVTVVVSDTAPANPVNGQIWHNSLNGVAYAYWSSQGVWVSM